MNKEDILLRRLGEEDVITKFDCGDEDAPTRLLYFDLESYK